MIYKHIQYSTAKDSLGTSLDLQKRLAKILKSYYSILGVIIDNVAGFIYIIKCCNTLVK